jgi:hypothetical protein
MAFTLDTTIGELLDNPAVKGTLEQHFPGATTNPLLGLFRGITLGNIVDNPEAAHFGITREKANAFLAEVNQFVQ